MRSPASCTSPQAPSKPTSPASCENSAPETASRSPCGPTRPTASDVLYLRVAEAHAGARSPDAGANALEVGGAPADQGADRRAMGSADDQGPNGQAVGR